MPGKSERRIFLVQAPPFRPDSQSEKFCLGDIMLQKVNRREKVVEYNARLVAQDAHDVKIPREHEFKGTHPRIIIVMENKTSSAMCTSAYSCLSQEAVPVTAYPGSHKLSANHRPGLSSPA